MNNRMMQGAIIREIEVIGEAAKNISRETRNKSRQIPWKQITGMRDKLIHHYFGVDLTLVWNTVQEALPHLKKQMEDILGTLLNLFGVLAGDEVSSRSRS